MQGAAKPDIRRSRRLARILAANPRAAIYGTIVASAAIATTAGGHESAALILEATLATLLVFWLAHVYADFLGHGLRHAKADLRLLAFILVQELSMLVAPALSILFLLLGALGVLEEALAVGLALWNGVVQLGPWTIQNQQSATGTPGRHAREHAQHAWKLRERALRELHDWEGQALGRRGPTGSGAVALGSGLDGCGSTGAGEAAHQVVDGESPCRVRRPAQIGKTVLRAFAEIARRGTWP